LPHGPSEEAVKRQPLKNAGFGVGTPVRSIVNRSVHYMRNLDRTFFALSDPTRRTILELLAAHPATIGELAQPFGLTLNGVKKHVLVLEDADLVITEKVGRARECRLGPAQLQDAARWIEEYRIAWQARLDRFGTYVERTDAE
jgi:DNA-binding transcriptional ArsR family regulator